jgi:hypothetical protein
MLLYYKHYVVYNILKQTTNILPHDVPMIFPWELPIFSMKKKQPHLLGEVRRLTWDPTTSPSNRTLVIHHVFIIEL